LLKIVKELAVIALLASLGNTGVEAGVKLRSDTFQGLYLTGQGADRRVRPRARVISPTRALRAAMNSSPGSQGLGVRYLQRLRGYIVRLRSGGRIHQVFVDGRTGRVRRR
jgi:hypothetical protein